MNKIITTFLSLLFAPMAFSQSNNHIDVKANIHAGCVLSANNVHFTLYGTEGFITSEYTAQEGRTETVWDSRENLEIRAQCSKNTQVQLHTTTDLFNSVGWLQLFHVSNNNPNQDFLVLFSLKNVSENIIHSGAYILNNKTTRASSNSIIFNFKDGNQGFANFSAEIDHNIGQDFKFLPGDYARTLDLTFDF